MVVISHIYKFIYLKNFKVAGSSVESFFGQFCIDPSKKGTYTFEDSIEESVSEYGIVGSRCNPQIKKWYNHKSAANIKKDLGADVFDSYFKFCVVRNPYDVMVSAFHWLKSTRSFKAFCKEFKHNHDTDNAYRMYIQGTPVCQAYIRYEHLTDDIVSVLERLGITDYQLSDLPNHKAGFRPSEKGYREYYDEETKAIVYRLFKTEIDMFGYSF